jgi:hypothetical protein
VGRFVRSNILRGRCLGVVALVAAAVLGMSTAAVAQTPTDEIQVYDAAISPKGVFNLTWHNNFTPIGLKTPAFPGAIIADKSFNGVTEWAYGVTDWFEQGLYLPVYSISKGRGATVDGLKVRELFVRPHADEHTFFYGVNFEFSYNASYWETKSFTTEVRPIVGLHLPPWDFIVNPIFDTTYTGLKNLEFVPAERVAYNFNDRWAAAIEEYADYGPVHEFYLLNGQAHNVWAVVDHNSKSLSFEAGIGFGLTSNSDKLVLKLMLMRDLNQPRKGLDAASQPSL